MFANIRLKLILLLLLAVIPQSLSAYYVFHPCCSLLKLYGWWGSADYLYIWRKERFFPALVTTNDLGNPPTLTAPGTRVLFGDARYGGVPKSGLQADVGVWVTPCWGAGTGFFGVGQEKITYDNRGNDAGFPILGRPFFNTAINAEDAELVSFPATHINGIVEIDSYNRMLGYDLYVTRRVYTSSCFKVDMLGGFCCSGLTDTLNITTHTTEGPFRIKENDQFNCRNNFYAGLLGIRSEWRGCNWAIAAGAKVGFGNMKQEVRIKGHTTITAAGVPFEFEGGLLAEPSNIGEHTFTQFEAIPQLYANLQTKVWGHLWFKAGYTYMYWPSVLLAGEQINLHVNPTQVPGPTVGVPEPIFHHRDKNFWIQGITAGFYIFY